MAARHRLNRQAAMAQLRDRRGGAARDFYRRGKRVEGVSKRLVGVDQGQLRADLHTAFCPEPAKQPGVRVGSGLKHARLHHDGHGEIRPVRAKVLRFQSRKTGGRMVFAMRVRAWPGNPYLKNALPAARG